MSDDVQEQPKPKKLKKPQDHKSKDDDVKVVEIGGVEYKIDPGPLDDFELMGALGVIESGGVEAIAAMPGVLKAFLGPVQYRSAMDAIRDKTTGRVSIDGGVRFLREMMDALNPNS